MDAYASFSFPSYCRSAAGLKHIYSVVLSLIVQSDAPSQSAQEIRLGIWVFANLGGSGSGKLISGC